MMGEVELAIGRGSPGLHVPRNSHGGKDKSDETEGRDVKKDMHACFKKDNKVRGFVQLIRACGGIRPMFHETGVV